MIPLLQDIEKEEIKSEDAEHLDYWMKKQLAKRFYENSGYAVLLGDDFENNILIHMKGQYPFMDRYTQIKTGKKDPFIEKYNKTAAAAMPNDDMIKFLYISRLCSYVGGPGMCDMILIKDGKYFLGHLIAEDSMRPETALFIFLSKFIFGICDVKMIDVTDEKKGRNFTIDFAKIFSMILDDGVLKKRWQNIDESFDIFAKRYKEKIPFFILQKWVAKGEADGNDIFTNFKNLYQIVNEENQEMLKLKSSLESDPKFMEIGKGMDTITLERKLAYIQEKHNMPKSDAIALLNLFL